MPDAPQGIHAYLLLSTSHLSAADMSRIGEWGGGYSRPPTKVSSHYNGYWIAIPEGEAGFAKLMGAALKLNMSEGFRAALNYAKQHGCSAIGLDPDVSPIPSIPLWRKIRNRENEYVDFTVDIGQSPSIPRVTERTVRLSDPAVPPARINRVPPTLEIRTSTGRGTATTYSTERIYSPDSMEEVLSYVGYESQRVETNPVYGRYTVRPVPRAEPELDVRVWTEGQISPDGAINSILTREEEAFLTSFGEDAPEQP